MKPARNPKRNAEILRLYMTRRDLSISDIADTVKRKYPGTTRNTVAGVIYRTKEGRGTPPRRPRGNKGIRTYKHNIQFGVDDETYAQLKAVAEPLGMSELLRTFVEWGLETMEGDENARKTLASPA